MRSTEKQNGNNKAEKTSVQFRVGKSLLGRMKRAAVASGDSRNTWIEQAVATFVQADFTTKKLDLTASEILADKTTVIARLEPSLVSKMNRYCDRQNRKRTIVLLDACISKLAEDRAEA